MTAHIRETSLRRRGAVVILVVVTMVVLLGFAALTVDVGAMHNARADLQRTADSASLAAAAMLSEFQQGDPIVLAREAAMSYARQNFVLGQEVQISPDADITFLRAHFDGSANAINFTPTNTLPDAVRVTVRLSENSPNGPLALFFANIFGKATTNVSASATAMMVPRDIAFAADLSASHNDDSELRHYQSTDINIHDVWAALPGGIADIDSVWNVNEIPPEWVDGDGNVTQAAGPGWGFMKRLGFGSMDIDSSYNPNADSGLVRLGYREAWSDAQLSTFLAEQGYSGQEVNSIMGYAAGDSLTVYPYRVAVALGLAHWNSGMAGGRWQSQGLPAGNGNSIIGASEVVWSESLMGRSTNESATIWYDYIRNYALQTNNYMYQANTAFRYQYGIKTFVNYLLEARPEYSQTPEFVTTPAQPMQAVKDGVKHMMDVLVALDTDDQVSLEVYGTTGRHEVDLTNDFMSISNRLKEMQAAHYDRYTNMGAGIQRAIEELSSSRARSGSRKIIVLYTDGIANVDEGGNVNYAGAKSFALAKAQEAASLGFRIYAVSVGVEPDLAFMNEIAAIGNGEHFHAQGTIEEYSAQLDAIFNVLGGKRQIQLVQ